MNSPISSECSICLGQLSVPPEQTGISSAFGRWCGKFIKRSFRIRENTIVTLSPCMHQFHYPCIRLWAKKTFRCPVDRGLLMKVSESLKASIDGKKELLSSIELNQLDEVKYLLATGLDPNFTSGRTGKNPLLLALKLQYWNIVAELISHGATNNHPEAQERLGLAYQQGAGVKRNYKMAVDLFFRSAAQGHVLALSDLGWMYQHGLGVRQDYVEALNLYRRGAMKGSAVAQNNLGCMYLNGFGVIQDYRKAVSWFNKAAKKGLTSALINLAHMNLKGQGVKQSNKKALALYRQAAESGCMEAQLCLARVYLKGAVVERSYQQAFVLLSSSAGQGHPSAQNDLGWIYQHGLGVQQDLHKAVYWYRKSAEQGSDEGENNFGYLCLHGLGVEADYQKACALFKKSAKRGFAAAQSNLAWMYLNGLTDLSAAKSRRRAMFWLRRSADQNYPPALGNLGVLCLDQDYSEAKSLLFEAAGRGDVMAMSNLVLLAASERSGDVIQLMSVTTSQWNDNFPPDELTGTYV